MHEALIEAARRITVPVQVLLPGDHRTIRWVGLDEEFLARHLGRASMSPA